MFKRSLLFLLLATAPVHAQQVSQGQYRATVPVLTDGQVAPVQLDSDGSLYVNIRDTDAAVPSYDAAVVGLVPAAAATDIACLTAGSTKTLYVSHISASGTATAATVVDIVLVRRSTVDTGGTSAAATVVPRVSTSAAGTGVLTTWTVNPAALGTLVGNVDASKLTLVTTAATQPYTIDNGVITTQPYTISGTQALCINYNAQTVAGNNIDIHFTWSEK